jgi:DNA helicase-2/ATP-dependent DNA helicase PcrA
VTPPPDTKRAALIDVLEGLNPAQREAVEHGDGPLLIFAGAGSGKTRVLTTRIGLLVEKKRAFPERILAVTFTNKAAREMRSRVDRLVEADLSRMWVGTFHSTAVKVLRREAEALGIPSSFAIFDEDDTRAAIRRVLDDLGLDQKRYKPGAIAERISTAKNELVGPDNYPSGDYFEEIVGRCYRRYEELRIRSGGLDFDDLIVYMVRLYQENEEALARWQDRFRHVLVDEYQDTNHAQYVLVNRLAAQHRNLAVVGDDDQSIYGWRGADVRNILDFQKDYPDAHVVRLEQNYRSIQPILDTAYQVIRNNPDRAEKKLWTDRAGGERTAAVQAYNEVEEAEFVADEIDRLRRVESRTLGDFAVLYRTNAQSRAFEDVLGRRRIAYRLVGGVRFWERREIKDVLAYLRLIQNPADSLAFARIANVPRRKLGDVSVNAVVTQTTSTGIGVLDALAAPDQIPGLPPAAIPALGRLHDQLMSLRAVVGVLRPSELIDHVIEVTGLQPYYEDGTLQGEARLENLRELRGLAQEFDELEPGEATQEFLTEVALVSDVDSYDESGEGVTLITLHMVKGLEFAVVFLVGMEEGLLPHQRNLETEAGIAEERRLCYVGITRAEDRLYLSCAFRRHLYGRSAPAFPSRFLSEIPQSLLRPARGGAPIAPPRDGYRERMRAREVAAAPAPPPVQRFAAGDRVEHPSFGAGVILKSTLTRTDEELMVKFDSAGLKILSGTLAPLTKR